MIGARSRRITGPAPRAKNTANSGPRRSAIGSAMISPSTSRPLASRHCGEASRRPLETHLRNGVTTIGSDRPVHLVASIDERVSDRSESTDVPGSAGTGDEHPQRTLHGGQCAPCGNEGAMVQRARLQRPVSCDIGQADHRPLVSASGGGDVDERERLWSRVLVGYRCTPADRLVSLPWRIARDRQHDRREGIEQSWCATAQIGGQVHEAAPIEQIQPSAVHFIPVEMLLQGGAGVLSSQSTSIPRWL